MADNWRILDFTTFQGKVYFDKNKRVLCATERDTDVINRFSLNDVSIIFIGTGVELASAVTYHLATHDVVVVFCDWRGMPVSSLYPWIDAHGRVATRQRAQASLSVPRSKNAWMRIVKAKIRGQANNLDTLGFDEAASLREMASSVRSGDIENKEAQAAKVYWRALFKDTGFKRVPGERYDEKNSLLDYGYTILRGHSMRAVLAAGLTPALGLYHKGRSNAFALADDLIEPFRPAVDYAVATMNQNIQADDKEVRHALLDATVSEFNESGETIPTVMSSFAQQFGRYAEGEISFLEVPVWKRKGAGVRDED